MDETCAHCGEPIAERPIATIQSLGFAWYHDRGADQEFRWQRACGWAEPTPTADVDERAGGDDE
jgi:hypothetical protein